MMLIANSFDLWQKDAFFSAAEEVQKSADIMESVYRTWKRMKKIQDQSVQDFNTFSTDLQIALGTTKWQMDTFEKAVSSSYINTIDDTTNILRHRQFIDAIKSQIFEVETELRDGKRPFRWVNLDEDDCYDLAAFLSGSLTTSQVKKDRYCSSSSTGISSSSGGNSYSKVDPEGILIDIKLEQVTGLLDNSPNSCSWKLEISDDDERKDKDKQMGFNCLDQIIGRPLRQRQLQTPPSFQFTSSRFKFSILLIVFLMVPFLLFTT